MKTIKFFISSLIFLSFIISFNSCSEDGLIDDSSIETVNFDDGDLTVKRTSQTNLNAKQIGDFHNIAVDLFLNNNYGKRKTVKEIEQTVVQLLSDNYPELMENFKMPTNHNSIASVYDSYSINESQLERIIDQGFSEITTNRNISNDFYLFIKDLTLTDNTVEDKLLQIQSFRTKSNDETELLEVYQEVLMASNELWNRRWSNSRLSCSSGVIAADAARAALGLFGSPLWSIIQGAVVSIAVNEDCE
ncbi:tudor domain-containing protein [Olleya aquimaris]|uniref:Uncharacterized protein n=1 Tax=Olleya aquimaris TaxID=639310 RepID=A0A327R714_9FLAO|nr:hypothetical protein [Olleya aquimaris]RAJ11898.1 hypothetical protein LY08_02607 [Olleya aquimaris]